MESTDQHVARSAFVWYAGGWFGTQFGCTLWMLILGFVLLSRDRLGALACIAGFLILNAWGLYRWQSKARLTAYAGQQRFLLVASVIVAAVVSALNLRGLSAPPAPGTLVSTYLPYWVILLAPGLMLLFHWRERKVAQGPK